jgi:ABC-type phosphate/phosphonate transport system substrate-binding protein
MATIARAVHHAHNKDVLHRDLKPANILVDQQGEPHLTDFGLAKMLGPAAAITPSSITGSGGALGTPSYMSPEQAAGQRLAPTSDVYSLGTILYEMLTGAPPFKANTLLELLRLVAEQEPRVPSSQNLCIDKDLDTICLKCLEKNPDARYPTAEALAEDLEHWLKGEPISARRVGLLPRTLRWIRRNQVGSGLIASLCAGLAVSVTLLLFQLRKGEQRRIEREYVAEQISKNIDNAWTNDSVELVPIPSRDLAALVDRPIPKANALTLTFALNIPDNPVAVATTYARFLGELEKQMSRRLGKQVNFDLQLHKARSWEAVIGARKGADLQGMTFLTYVRMREVSPTIQPLVIERHRSEAAIYARANVGVSNLTQVSGHRVVFAHTNSIISFLAKVALAKAGLCANNFAFYTNLNAPQLQSPHTSSPKVEADAEGLGSESYAHKEVLARVLNGEFEVGVAPYRRFHMKQNDGVRLVELHHYQNTPDVYVARAGLPPDEGRALRDSLLAIKDKALLSRTKPGMREGFEPVTDADFDSFRKLIRKEWSFFETFQTNPAPGQTKAPAASAKEAKEGTPP